MKKNLLLISGILLFSLILGSCQAPWEDPPKTLQVEDLVGEWTVSYGQNAKERIIIRDDGLFKQIYHNPQSDYLFETDWHRLWLEHLPSGKVRLHLEGARYYGDGIEWAEREGYFPGEEGNSPWPYYDPFENERYAMIGEMVVNVRQTCSNELIFHHNFLSSDDGFALFGGGRDIFHRVEVTE